MQAKGPINEVETDKDKIFNIILNYLFDNNYHNIKYENDLLIWESLESEKHSLTFSKISKNILQLSKDTWETRINEFLAQSLNINTDLFAILNNLDKLKSLLTIRLIPKSIFEEEPLKSNLEKYIYNEIIPDVFAILALELSNTFHYLRSDIITKFHVDRKALFEIANDNLNSHISQVNIKSGSFNGVELTALFDSDYSAAYAICSMSNQPEAIKTKGTLVSIPCKGSAFMHRIKGKDELELALQKIAELTNKFYLEEPGPITQNLYWFNNGIFTKFQLGYNSTIPKYDLPKGLKLII